MLLHVTTAPQVLWQQRSCSPRIQMDKRLLGVAGAALGATAQKMPRPVRVQRDGMRQVLGHLDDTLARYDGAGKTGAKALAMGKWGLPGANEYLPAAAAAAAAAAARSRSAKD